MATAKKVIGVELILSSNEVGYLLQKLQSSFNSKNESTENLISRNNIYYALREAMEEVK